MVNLRATLPGATPGTDRLVIAGHYDTKLFREFRFVGASDGGSSAAFLLELARVLKARAERVHDRAAVPRRRGSGRRVGRAPTTPTAAATTSTQREAGRHAQGHPQALRPGRHDRRPRSATSGASTNSTPWLTDVDLERRASGLKRPRVPRRDDADRRRPPAVPRGRRAVGRHHRSRLPTRAPVVAWHTREDTPRQRARRADASQAVGDVAARSRAAGRSRSSIAASSASATAHPCAVRARSRISALGQHGRGPPSPWRRSDRRARRVAGKPALLQPEDARSTCPTSGRPRSACSRPTRLAGTPE